MKAVLAMGCLAATLAFAEGPADLADIGKVVNSLTTAKPASTLFTADADSDLARLLAANRGMSDAALQPWSEVTPPRISIQSIRFVTPDVALVNAASTQLGSMPRRVPILLVMKKAGTEWKIASLRVLSVSAIL